MILEMEERWQLLEKFHKYHVLHPKLRIARDQIISLISSPERIKLIFLVGPKGSDRETLMRTVEAWVIENLLPQLSKDRELMPMIRVTVPAPEYADFAWNGLFRRMLRACDEVLVEKKSGPDYLLTPRPYRALSALQNRDALKFSVEQTLLHRRPAAVVLEGAERLRKGANGLEFLGHLDVLDFLARKTSVPHILVGDYRMLDYLELDNHIVHLPRYLSNSTDERREFLGIARDFALQMDLREIDHILSNADYLFQKTLGCVDTLKDWFGRALRLCLDEKRSQPTWDDLTSTALSGKACRKLIQDIQAGEALLADSAEALTYVRDTLLGISAAPRNPKAFARDLAPGRSKPTRAPLAENPIKT